MFASAPSYDWAQRLLHVLTIGVPTGVVAVGLIGFFRRLVEPAFRPAQIALGIEFVLAILASTAFFLLEVNGPHCPEHLRGREAEITGLSVYLGFLFVFFLGALVFIHKGMEILHGDAHGELVGPAANVEGNRKLAIAIFVALSNVIGLFSLVLFLLFIKPTL